MSLFSRVVLFIFLSVAFISNAAGKIVDNDEFIITAEFDKKEYFSNESGLLTIWLYTTNPNLNGFEEISPVSVDKGEFAYFAKVNEMPRATHRKIKDKEYAAYPLGVYAIMFKNDGKYAINAGSYRLSVNEPVVVRDPFWGTVRTHRSEFVDVQGEKTRVKVKKLPMVEGITSFSGAVGNYKIEVTIPRGEIIINEPATAIITIEGEGLIGDDTMPDYHDSFKQGCVLKSVSDSNDYLYNGRCVVSRKVLECEFIPTDIKNCLISPVEFSFFNPKSGKYEILRSEPVSVNVKSSTVRITPIDI